MRFKMNPSYFVIVLLSCVSVSKAEGTADAAVSINNPDFYSDNLIGTCK